ncbi:hypothetical protein [Nostoc sp. NMS8]|uniref:hypothetical protein n=1 Tax=Nostoc sp. NMS8 TaxID=2815392 RepID=UPI0025DF3B4B|nr:hypothetical protein [Nostoc sp. NMS8]MBN3961007.1 hypothetical protein [Nostoc sp. NMS8]
MNSPIVSYNLRLYKQSPPTRTKEKLSIRTHVRPWRSAGKVGFGCVDAVSNRLVLLSRDLNHRRITLNPEKLKSTANCTLQYFGFRQDIKFWM